jgi:8-oxo-dGTP pyrophosphatase MutT (NUDIX family)
MKLSTKKLFLNTLGKLISSDLFSFRHPVSVKGICAIDGKLILLKTELGSWDLPGGKLKTGERPEDCLIREFKEELSIDVAVHKLITAVPILVNQQVNVLVLLYSCQTQTEAKPRISDEHYGMEKFNPCELNALGLPAPYLDAIQNVWQ